MQIVENRLKQREANTADEYVRKLETESDAGLRLMAKFYEVLVAAVWRQHGKVIQHVQQVIELVEREQAAVQIPAELEDRVVVAYLIALCNQSQWHNAVAIASSRHLPGPEVSFYGAVAQAMALLHDMESGRGEPGAEKRALDIVNQLAATHLKREELAFVLDVGLVPRASRLAFEGRRDADREESLLLDLWTVRGTSQIEGLLARLESAGIDCAAARERLRRANFGELRQLLADIEPDLKKLEEGNQ